MIHHISGCPAGHRPVAIRGIVWTVLKRTSTPRNEFYSFTACRTPKFSILWLNVVTAFDTILWEGCWSAGLAEQTLPKKSNPIVVSIVGFCELIVVQRSAPWSSDVEESFKSPNAPVCGLVLCAADRLNINVSSCPTLVAVLWRQPVGKDGLEYAANTLNESLLGHLVPSADNGN